MNVCNSGSPLAEFDAAISAKSPGLLKAALDLGLNPNTLRQVPVGIGQFASEHLLYPVLRTSCDECLEIFLAAGADPRLARDEYSTPLAVAASRGRVDMVRRLIAAGDDVNFSSKGDDWSVVHCAAAGGYVEILAELKASGAKIDVQTQSGRTPLMICADSAEATNWLLREIPHRINAQDENGITALMEAALVKTMKGMDVIDLHLEHGADLSLRTYDHAAATYKNATAAELAINAGNAAAAERISLFQHALQARALIESLRNTLLSPLAH